MRLVILYLLISVFLRILANLLMVMLKSLHTNAFDEVISVMMQLWISSGFKTKSHLEAMRL